MKSSLHVEYEVLKRLKVRGEISMYSNPTASPAIRLLLISYMYTGIYFVSHQSSINNLILAVKSEHKSIRFPSRNSSFLQAEMCPKKPTRQTVLQTWKAWKLYALFAATLLFATQCSWPYIYQIPPKLRRSDWPVVEEIDN